MDPLLRQLSENTKFDWIGRRIHHLWPDWVRALHTLEQMKPFSHEEKTVSARVQWGSFIFSIVKGSLQYPEVHVTFEEGREGGGVYKS